MPAIRVYFNKPGRPFDIALLIHDVCAAQEYVLVTSAWFTDVDVANAIIAVPAGVKTLILKAENITRASVKAYYRLERYFTTVHSHSSAPSVCAKIAFVSLVSQPLKVSPNTDEGS
ncbi:MAG: hypothetical protein RMJ55_09265, partial [Roseiflexaceae bacterium]|nr:hypothetical protein [Roseiflexaceae bacterium]